MFAGQRTPPDTLVCYVATHSHDTLVCNVAIHSTDTLVNYIHLLSVRKKYRKNKSLDFLTLAFFFGYILLKKYFIKCIEL